MSARTAGSVGQSMRRQNSTCTTQLAQSPREKSLDILRVSTVRGCPVAWPCRQRRQLRPRPNFLAASSPAPAPPSKREEQSQSSPPAIQLGGKLERSPGPARQMTAPLFPTAGSRASCRVSGYLREHSTSRCSSSSPHHRRSVHGGNGTTRASRPNIQ